MMLITKAGAWQDFLLKGQSHFSRFFFRCEMLFPSRNFHFGTRKTNFHHFEKWKAKKKKKKKKVTLIILELNFSLLPFQFSIFPFPIFLFFSILPLFHFFPGLIFSRLVSRNFPVRSLWGAHCPLPPPPPPVTPLHKRPYKMKIH